VCLVSPWMENENIVDFLKGAPKTNCVLLAQDIAEGLQYLHTLKPSIIHGDLKGLNILVTPAGRACLADFGLATARDSKPIIMSSMSSNRATGTLRWQAPELLNPESDEVDGRNSTASDVYAFACVCYEIFSGELPFHEMPRDYSVILAVMQGKRPRRQSHDLCRIRGLNNDMWNLIELCWTDRPSDRPAASRIVELLCALPDRPVDQRPLDEFNTSPSSWMLDSQPRHPFADIAVPADAPVQSV